MAKTKFATLHSGLLVRKGDAEPAPPPPAAPDELPAVELGAANMRGRAGTDPRKVQRNVLPDAWGDGAAPGWSEGAAAGATGLARGGGPDSGDFATVQSFRDILERKHYSSTLPVSETIQKRRDGSVFATVALSATEFERLKAIADRQEKNMMTVVREAISAMLDSPQSDE